MNRVVAARRQERAEEGFDVLERRVVRAEANRVHVVSRHTERVAVVEHARGHREGRAPPTCSTTAPLARRVQAATGGRVTALTFGEPKRPRLPRGLLSHMRLIADLPRGIDKARATANKRRRGGGGAHVVSRGQQRRLLRRA